ncbi:glutamate receptor ionotropic, kainate 2-like isoform X1 [Planococcus citri]|uniref:glutamate receptor ionotropic, kainate 2-like isoform X1 n=1 Tax=Planococcus citri TaxID=170843 RepID=UPI0031F8B519
MKVFVFIVISVLGILLCDGNRLTKHFPDSPQDINVVGIFGFDETDELEAFEAAINDINKDASLLRKTKLKNITKIVDSQNAFVIKNTICATMGDGISAVIGPNSAEGIAITQSIADFYKIPHLFSTHEPNMHKDSYSVNMFPLMRDFTKGIQEIIHDMDWAAFTLLYEDDQDLAIFQDLLIEHEKLGREENYRSITLKQLPKTQDYGPILKEIQIRTETRFVIRCAKENVIPFLRKAQGLKLMGDYFGYVIISLDVRLEDLREFQATGTNITTISIINPITYTDDEFSSDYDLFSRFVHDNVRVLKSQAFLMYDAVYLFAKALDMFLEDEVSDGDLLKQIPLSCKSKEPIFEEGASLMNFIKTTEIKMVTDHIKLNENGERIFHNIHIFGGGYNMPKRLGNWNPENRITYSRNLTEIEQENQELAANKTFTVSSMMGEPYLMPCTNASEQTGELIMEDGRCYTGFAKELMDYIAKERKFKYRIVLANSRGNYDANTGKWDGIIKEVQDRRADLGICDLTITHERRRAVDFTKPFMNLGISILYKIGKEEETEMFSFLKPLRFEVWLCVATSLLALSVTLFFVSRLSPYDWESPHPCDSNVEELENALSLVNSLWFSLGSVLQQGCDILPKATSSRIVASMWWFFTLIMVSTYTANLAAFLTTNKMDTEIKDVDQLASQSVIKYGCYKDGSTRTFFEKSSDALYQKMWANMESTKPSVFTKNNDEGVQRVLREKRFAFFMESSTIEYNVERNCRLTQVGGLLDNKAYGIAMPLNSPFRTSITTALLKLQEEGKVRDLKEKYWLITDESKKCQRKKKNDLEDNALAVAQVGGVFVVLLIGMAFSLILSILEFLWNIRKVAVIEKIPLKTAFWKELHFVLNCHITTKPVRKPSEKTSENNDPLDRYKAFMAFGSSQNQL